MDDFLNSSSPDTPLILLQSLLASLTPPTPHPKTPECIERILLLVSSEVLKTNRDDTRVLSCAMECIKTWSRDPSNSKIFSLRTRDVLTMTIKSLHRIPLTSEIATTLATTLTALGNIFLSSNALAGSLQTPEVSTLVALFLDLQCNDKYDLLFLTARVLFIVSAVSRDSCPTMLDSKICLGIQKVLERYVNLDVVDAVSPGKFGQDLVISEILKILFNLMHHTGSSQDPSSLPSEIIPATEALSSTRTKEFASLLPLVLKVIDRKCQGLSSVVLGSDSTAELKLEGVLLHALNALVNFDIDTTGMSDLDRRVAGSCLVDILDAQSDIDNSTIPVLLVLGRIVAQDPTIRQAVAKRVCPITIDRTRPLDQGPELIHRLIKELKAVRVESMNLRDCIGELMLSLFDKNVDAMVKYVGYGPLAGFLLSRNLTPFFETPGANEKKNVDVSAGGEEVVNPITGREWETENDSEMTDEEKEREAERLFVLFDRLNRNGIIKVQLPTEP